MCVICVELTGLAGMLAAMIPMLKPRLQRWALHRLKPHLRGQRVERA